MRACQIQRSSQFPLIIVRQGCSRTSVRSPGLLGDGIAEHDELVQAEAFGWCGLVYLSVRCERDTVSQRWRRLPLWGLSRRSEAFGSGEIESMFQTNRSRRG